MFEGSLTMAQYSFYATSAAAIIIAPAGPIAVDMYKAQCDPSAFYQGYEVWSDVTKTLDEAAKEVQSAVESISEEGWSGKDREAFEEKLKDYKGQLDAASFLSNAIAVILLTVAWALFLYIVMMAFIAAVLAALLLYIAVQSAVTLGAGFAAAVAEADAIVGPIYTGVWEPMTKALEVLLNAFAIMLGGALIVDLGKQAWHGNWGAFGDFVAAQGPAMDVIWRGSLNRLERKVTADLMSGGLSTETSAIPGLPKWTWAGLPRAGAGAANVKGTADVHNQGPSLTGGLIGKDNDQVG
jgi:ABC-type cobalt transport system substrate-binding protein